MDIAPQIQPILVAQGPVNVPVAVNLPMLDGDNNNNNNNNDSSVGETDNIMTDSVIAPPSFSGKAAQDPSDWIRHFILYGWCYAPENRGQSFVDPLCPRNTGIDDD